MKKQLLTVMLAAALPAMSASAGDFQVKQTYGDQSLDLMNSPVGIVEGSNGNMYVSDLGNGVLHKFDAQGNQIAIIAEEGNGEGQLNAPMDISFANGKIYVPELGTKRVSVFDENGNLVQVIGNGELKGPRGVWVEDNGDVTVLDEFGFRVVKYDADGNYLSECNEGLSKIGYVDDIIKVNGNYFITEATLNYVVELDNDCKFVAKYGSYGSGNDQFYLPRGINTDGEFIYVSDAGNNRVQKFDLDMNYVETIGGTYQLSGPNQIIKHSEGHYVVTSSGDHQIKWFDAAAPTVATKAVGSLRTGDGVLANPSGMDADYATEELYVANALNHRIDIFDLETGAFKRSFGQLGFGFSNGDMIAPQDAYVVGDNVLVTNRFLNKISIFDKNGIETGSFGAGGTEPGQFNQPYGIDVDGNGNIYVVDFGNHRVQKFDADFNVVWATAGFGYGAGRFWAPIRVVASDDGRVFVSDAYNNQVQVLDAETGAYITKIGSFGEEAGDLSLPFGVTIDKKGENLLVSEVANNRISVFSLEDYSFVKMASQLGSREEDLFFPYEITICHENGDICTSNAITNIIQRWSIKKD